MKILFFDTETTGLPRPSYGYNGYNRKHFLTCRMVEIGLILVKWRKEVHEFSILAKTSMLVKVENLTPSEERIVRNFCKISANMMKEEARDIDIVLKVVIENFLKKANRIVCHNTVFDCNVLISEFSKANMQEGIELMEWLPRWCTMENEIKYDQDKHVVQLQPYLRRQRLAAVCERLGVVNERNHRALSDATATLECFIKQISNCLSDKDKLLLGLLPISSTTTEAIGTTAATATTTSTSTSTSTSTLTTSAIASALPSKTIASSPSQCMNAKANCLPLSTTCDSSDCHLQKPVLKMSVSLSNTTEHSKEKTVQNGRSTPLVVPSSNVHIQTEVAAPPPSSTKTKATLIRKIKRLGDNGRSASLLTPALCPASVASSSSSSSSPTTVSTSKQYPKSLGDKGRSASLFTPSSSSLTPTLSMPILSSSPSASPASSPQAVHAPLLSESRSAFSCSSSSCRMSSSVVNIVQDLQHQPLDRKTTKRKHLQEDTIEEEKDEEGGEEAEMKVRQNFFQHLYGDVVFRNKKMKNEYLSSLFQND